MSTVLTFGQAMDQARKGFAVSAGNWSFIERLSTHTDSMEVDKEKIWSPVTRLMMDRTGLSSVVVEPYSTKIVPHGNSLRVYNYIPNNEDMNDHWMLSTTTRRLVGLEIDEDDFNLTFDMTDENESFMFKDLYKSNCIGYGRDVIFIGGSVSANIRNATIYNMMDAHLDNRIPGDKTFDGFTTNADFLKDGWLGYCNHRTYGYRFINIDAVDLTFYDDINSRDAIIIVDKYSLDQFNMKNGENAYKHVSNILVQVSNPVYYLDMVKELDGYNSI